MVSLQLVLLVFAERRAGTLPDCLRPTVQQQHGAGNGIRFSAISYAKKEVLANGNNLLTTQGTGHKARVRSG